MAPYITEKTRAEPLRYSLFHLYYSLVSSHGHTQYCMFTNNKHSTHQLANIYKKVKACFPLYLSFIHMAYQGTILTYKYMTGRHQTTIHLENDRQTADILFQTFT